MQPLCRTSKDANDNYNKETFRDTSPPSGIGSNTPKGSDTEDISNLYDGVFALGGTGPRLEIQHMDHGLHTMGLPNASEIDFSMGTSQFMTNDETGSSNTDLINPFLSVARPEPTTTHQNPPARHLPRLTPPVLRQSSVHSRTQFRKSL